MKKVIYSVALVASLIGLSACGETEKESVKGDVKQEETSSDTTATDETKKEEKKEDVKDEENKIDQVIVDNDSYKITLLEIIKKDDEFMGKSIDVVYEVENKLDYAIGVQARSVSADGYMVDEAIISMSQEVVGGKKAKAVMNIMEVEDYDFPELKENLEMSLHIFNHDSFDEIENIPVNVEIK